LLAIVLQEGSYLNAKAQNSIHTSFRKLYKPQTITKDIKEVYRMKKGSLDLSIQAIVIIVLAMTLLGLGLGFIRSQLGSVTDISSEVQAQVREDITGKLRTSGEKISFPREVSFNRGSSKVVTLGVQNIGAQALFFKLDLSFDVTNSDDGYDDFNLRYDQSCLQLLPAESEVYGINVIAPRTPGTFALRGNILQFQDESCLQEETLGGGLYATKLSFITVG